jgi:phage terminase large subunit
METLSQFKIELTQKQEQFVLTPARFACMSGGYGSGKSYAGCLRGLILSQFPKNVGLIGRLSYPELRDTTRKTFFDLCPVEWYDEKRGGRWSPTENHLTLINGSEILFRHLDTVSEAELKSLNIGWFFIDQAEEIGLPIWHVLQSRLRLNTVPNRYGFVSCNPEPGSWIEDIFKRPFDEGTLPKDYFHLDTATYDNPHLPADYVEVLKANYPEEMQARYIEGSWKAMQNLIYPEFEKDIHVIRPFVIPQNWEKIIALDHGMVNPTGVTFAAIDYDSNVFIYDEYYNPGLVSEHAKAIKQKVGEQNISMWLIDPSTQAKTREKDGRMWSVIEEYEDFGLYFVPANNQMLAGINRVKEFLKVNPKRIHPITRKRPSPRLFIFQSCVNLIWEIRQYKWRKYRGMALRNLPEQPVDYADHLLDSLRYTIMSRFPPPVRAADGRLMIDAFDRKNMNLITVKPPKQPDVMFGEWNADSLFTNSPETYN